MMHVGSEWVEWSEREEKVVTLCFACKLLLDRGRCHAAWLPALPPRPFEKRTEVAVILPSPELTNR